MDWFSWLSRSNLEPSLICEYALAFTRNELQKEDVSFFNHEFLQSMGISVAKHRLEILKLANKDIRDGSHKNFSKIVSSSLNKTRKRIAKCINKLIFHEVDASRTLRITGVSRAAPSCVTLNYPEQSKEYKISEKETQVDLKPVLTTRRVAKSGPLLDRRVVQEKKMMEVDNHRSLNLSGPLDRNLQERLVFTYRSPISSGPNRSPNLSGPLNKRPPSPRVYADYSKKLGVGGGGFEDQTLWSSLFQDLKPT